MSVARDLFTATDFLDSLQPTERAELVAAMTGWMTEIEQLFSPDKYHAYDIRDQLHMADARLNAILGRYNASMAQVGFAFSAEFTGRLLQSTVPLHVHQVGGAGPDGLHRAMLTHGMINIGRGHVASILNRTPDGRVVPTMRPGYDRARAQAS